MKRFIFSALLSVFLLNSFVANAQMSCRAVFSPLNAPVVKEDYRTLDTNLKDRLQRMSEADRKAIKHILNALYFFDYKHIGYEFIKTFDNSGKTFRTIDLRAKYGGPLATADSALIQMVDGIFGPIPNSGPTRVLGPYENFETVVKLIRNQDPPRGYKTLKAIHTEMMRGGVENVTAEQLGVARTYEVIGNATHEAYALADKEVQAIDANPYLTFEAQGKTTSGKNLSRIWYTSIQKMKPKIIERLRTIDPVLADKVLDIQRNNGLTRDLNAQLLPKVIDALVQERFNDFETRRSQLGPIQSAKNEIDYINLVAGLHVDLVSIHPFANGNGRSTHAYMNMLLMKEGIAPTLLTDTWADIQIPREDWKKAVARGVESTKNLLADITRRIDQGLPIENSPYLLNSGIPETAKIDLKAYNKTKPMKAHRDAQIDQAQFAAFIKSKIAHDPAVLAKIKADTLKAMSDLVEEFVVFFQQKTVDYIHEKEGLQEVALRFADPDFISQFGVNLAGSSSLWSAKIDRNYKRDLIWRGLSHKTYEFKDSDLLSYFTQFRGHLLSNRVARYANQSQNVIREQVKEDFDDYNLGLITGDYKQMVIDHSTTGPLYGNSYGLSTSKREIVGKAFAMGAMVIAPYGQHNTPELQALLKSRINIASYRAEKDIDLGRMHQVEESFVYKYPRQAEVMAVGGIEPDAVMNIQRIGVDGKVIHTFARDPENPSVVYKISGRWVHGEEPLPTTRILETFRLAVED